MNMEMENVIKKEIKTEVGEINRRSAGFICPKCQSHFLCSDLFVEHVREHHTNSSSRDLNGKSLSHYHTQTDHTSDVDSIVTSCELIINSESAVAKVSETNLGARSHECKTCSRSFAIKSRLNRHEKTHTGEKPFNCKICSRSFTRKEHLMRHIKVTHPDNYRLYLKCETCLLSFDNLSALAVHKKTHTVRKMYKCETCFRSFTRKIGLIRHRRRHTGERPFRCETCSRTFFVKAQLNNHKRTHTGEKPYKCETCSRSFARKDHLMKHMIIHSKNRQCVTCLQSFPREEMIRFRQKTYDDSAKCSRSASDAPKLKSNIHGLEKTHIDKKSTKYKFTYSRSSHLAQHCFKKRQEMKITQTVTPGKTS